MEYLKEVDQILNEWLRADWMSDDDYKEAQCMFFETTGITKQKLSDDIKTGVNNGYSVEYQIGLANKLFKD